jgi:hypothetical protein
MDSAHAKSAANNKSFGEWSLKAIKYVLSLFDSGDAAVLAGRQQSQKAQNQAILKSIDNLKALSELTRTVFDVSSVVAEMLLESEIEEGPDMNAISDGKRHEYLNDGNGYYQEIAPGVLTPDVNGENKLYLTAAGKMQVCINVHYYAF